MTQNFSGAVWTAVQGETRWPQCIKSVSEKDVILIHGIVVIPVCLLQPWILASSCENLVVVSGKLFYAFFFFLFINFVWIGLCLFCLFIFSYTLVGGDRQTFPLLVFLIFTCTHIDKLSLFHTHTITILLANKTSHQFKAVLPVMGRTVVIWATIIGVLGWTKCLLCPVYILLKLTKLSVTFTEGKPSWQILQ